eukprot:5524496-Amphidinium_carterae.1
MAGKWKVWTAPDGWQDWSYQEPKEPSQRSEGREDATKQAYHEVKVEPTSHSQSAGSKDEWVAKSSRSGGQQAWSQPPVRTQAATSLRHPESCTSKGV